jgi:hypothetical protein
LDRIRFINNVLCDKYVVKTSAGSGDVDCIILKYKTYLLEIENLSTKVEGWFVRDWEFKYRKRSCTRVTHRP